MSVFINLTNHPSTRWSAAQYDAAMAYGPIVDFPFPAIPVEADTADVAALAGTIAEQLFVMAPAAVLIQGEHVFVYQLVSLLQAAGILALSCISRREATEHVLLDGGAEKTSVFRFVGFRRYW